jgi:hypothetical protein
VGKGGRNYLFAGVLADEDAAEPVDDDELDDDELDVDELDTDDDELEGDDEPDDESDFDDEPAPDGDSELLEPVDPFEPEPPPARLSVR